MGWAVSRSTTWLARWLAGLTTTGARRLAVAEVTSASGTLTRQYSSASPSR